DTLLMVEIDQHATTFCSDPPQGDDIRAGFTGEEIIQRLANLYPYQYGFITRFQVAKNQGKVSRATQSR
ncbi:hypothetical protein GGI1_01406, partial [Acidithiobacillus sp. GGI-221]